MYQAPSKATGEHSLHLAVPKIDRLPTSHQSSVQVNRTLAFKQSHRLLFDTRGAVPTLSQTVAAWKTMRSTQPNTGWVWNAAGYPWGVKRFVVATGTAEREPSRSGETLVNRSARRTRLRRRAVLPDSDMRETNRTELRLAQRLNGSSGVNLGQHARRLRLQLPQSPDVRFRPEAVELVTERIGDTD